ncbi:MAG: YdcF family protein [Patescibacteria group bacterium]
MTNKEKFIILVTNEKLKKANAIILLEGDGYFRVPKAVELYKNKWAPKIVVSGGVDNKNYGSFSDIGEKVKQAGVPSKDIILEKESTHTREQAINIIKMCKDKKWKRIILVASHYHQARAFLTFLKAMQEEKIKIQIINAPANNLGWFSANKWGKRMDLLDAEFERINKYSKLGHIATYTDAVAYQEWKEKQR